MLFRSLLYGTQGIGKSTWAAMADRTIFIPTEDGLNDIDCQSFPLVESYDDAMDCIAELYSGEHDFGTVAIDSADWLEKFVWRQVCQQRGVESIEDVGYGKGYVFALAQWNDILGGLTALRDHRNMSIILLAHANIERFNDPGTDPYDRYAPRLHKHTAALLQEWCDEVFFATYKVMTKQSEEGFGKKRTRAVGEGERVIRTTERPSHYAKNRIAGLPDELPLDYRAYAVHLGTA